MWAASASLLLLLAACGEKEVLYAVEEDDKKVKITESKENAPISLVLEDGQFEDEELYILFAVEEALKSNPYIGEQGKHDLLLVNVVSDKEFPEENYALLFSINRTDQEIGEYSFDLTLGAKNEGYVFQDKQVKLSKENHPFLKPNEMSIIKVPIDVEQYELTSKMFPVNTVFEIKNLRYE